MASGAGPLLDVLRDELAEELRATGKWHEAALPAGDGRTVVYVASVCGVIRDHLVMRRCRESTRGSVQALFHGC